MSTELDALGDELLDEDSSYLDDAAVPSIPEGIPIDKSTNRVTLTLTVWGFTSSLLCFYLLFFVCVWQDGVLVDEFGLPQIPAT